MKQVWIIEDHWSEYHALIARQQGWGLVHMSGMWQIASLDERKFANNEASRLWVLAHEHDRDSSLCAMAINAMIVGNMR